MCLLRFHLYFVLFSRTATTKSHTLPLHDALPIYGRRDPLGSTHHEAGTLRMGDDPATSVTDADCRFHRSEEHTSELQSPMYLVCRLLLEKKNDKHTEQQYKEH